jgi:hypothetical protein
MWEETILAYLTFLVSTLLDILKQATKNVSKDSWSSL